MSFHNYYKSQIISILNLPILLGNRLAILVYRLLILPICRDGLTVCVCLWLTKLIWQSISRSWLNELFFVRKTIMLIINLNSSLSSSLTETNCAKTETNTQKHNDCNHYTSTTSKLLSGLIICSDKLTLCIFR